MHVFRSRRGRIRRGASHRRVSYANVASTLALVVALGGGTAWAANHYLITSRHQIKPSVLASLRGKRGRTGANGVNGTDGKNGARGATGPTGSNASINGLAAGGVLEGTYPNPKLHSGSVTDSSFANTTASVAEVGGTVSVAGTTPTMEKSFDRLALGAGIAVTRTGLGVYDVSIPGLSNFYFSHEITQITPLGNGSGAPVIAEIGSIGGDLLVELYNAGGTHVDSGFSFVIYD
jgi:hypothetical protein